MHRKFIALIIACSVVITGFSAAPARADQRDVAKLLAGLAALAVIGVAIENRRDDNRPVASHPGYHPPASHPGYHPPRPVPPRPLPAQVSRRTLPEHCLNTYNVNHRSVRLFGQRCLNNSYRHTKSLPYACQYQFRQGRETRTGYEPRCLRERGYRFARR